MQYGDFFPGTGALGDVGTGSGRNYSVNVPLQEGMDDDSYRFVFEPIMSKARFLPLVSVQPCNLDQQICYLLRS